MGAVIQGMRDWDSGPAEITLESRQRIISNESIPASRSERVKPAVSTGFRGRLSGRNPWPELNVQHRVNAAADRLVTRNEKHNKQK